MISLNEYVKQLYNQSSADNLLPFPTEERNKYYQTGNRQDFEKLYFRRRDFLSSCAFLALSDESFIPQLERIIIAVCDEYCWALPAHTSGIKEDDEKTIDLFAAETSFTLAEINTVFEDKLSSDTKCRIKIEIEKRLVKNYKEHKFWWETCRMNWASVCGAFTGGTLIYLFPEEFENQKTRILETLRCYIDGFSDDGTCMEGAEYWLYGFSSFTYFADLLFRYSHGKTDLFDNIKVKKTAGYIERIFLKGNTVVSFSDADINTKADIALQYYLSKKLPGYVNLLPESRMSIRDGNTKWPCLYRTAVWKDERKTENESLKNYIGKDQIIIHKDGYSLAFKGGNNDEPHNHNDLGSFIFADEDGQVLCDLGAGRYSKDYFSEKRYGVFCNSSSGHSVPIINSKEQGTGEKYTVNCKYESDVITADITGAYDEEKLKSFQRTLICRDKSVLLIDKAELYDKISVIDRFITLRKPVIRENEVVLGDTHILFDNHKVSLKINEYSHLPHGYDAEEITVYCLDFTFNDNEVIFELCSSDDRKIRKIINC